MNNRIRISRPVRQYRFQDHEMSHRSRRLAEETALEIMVNGRSLSLLMETPGHERELTIGYLYTEGLLNSPAEVAEFTVRPGRGILDIGGLQAEVILPGLDHGADWPERLSLSMSSCGLCGKESLEQVGRGISRVTGRQHFPLKVLREALPDLIKHQPLYEDTHGVHAAALYDAGGNFHCCFEDVGRHNALDKVIGHCLLKEISFKDKFVVLSGRASLEMMLKTARAGIPLFLCFSNPTVLAVEAAKYFNITLVGREDRRSLAAYTHVRRIDTVEKRLKQ